MPPTKSGRQVRTVTAKKLQSAKQFDLKDLDFTLVSDAKTLAEIDEIQAKAIKAAQKMRKYAWR